MLSGFGILAYTVAQVKLNMWQMQLGKRKNSVSLDQMVAWSPHVLLTWHFVRPIRKVQPEDHILKRYYPHHHYCTISGFTVIWWCLMISSMNERVFWIFFRWNFKLKSFIWCPCLFAWIEHKGQPLRSYFEPIHSAVAVCRNSEVIFLSCWLHWQTLGEIWQG